MKSECVPTEAAQPLVFPLLMKSSCTDVVVLITGRRDDSNLVGTAVYSTDSMYSIGYHSSGWNAKVFSPYTGQIRLNN